MHDYVLALLGGLLMGSACAALFVFNGRILGISGVLGGVLKLKAPDNGWRWSFLTGMIVAGGLALVAYPGAFEDTVERSLAATIGAGVLVGVGTQLGSGCTSGHGICGIGRLSKRSIAATVGFIVCGAITVTLIRLQLNGSV